MEDFEMRKKRVLANWNLLTEQTRELLKSIGINGESVQVESTSNTDHQTLLVPEVTL